MIRGVLFDVTGVLNLPDATWIALRLRALGVPVTDLCALDRAYYLGTAAYDTQKRQLRQRPGGIVSAGPVPRLTFGTAYALGAGLAARYAPQVEQVLLHQPVPIDQRLPVAGAAAALRRLSAAGFRLGLVANSADGQTAAWLDRWAARSRVPVTELTVIDSAVAGLRKPDPRIYAAALSGLGLAPGQVLHVGDSLHLDVLGARAAGLSSLHFDPFAVCTLAGHPHAATHGGVLSHVLALPLGAHGCGN